MKTALGQVASKSQLDRRAAGEDEGICPLKQEDRSTIGTMLCVKHLDVFRCCVTKCRERLVQPGNLRANGDGITAKTK